MRSFRLARADSISFATYRSVPFHVASLPPMRTNVE
jgi:hypothetical protein